MALALEIFAVIAGLGYIFLAAKNNPLCWPIGIVGSATSIVLFVVYSQLYSEAILYGYYVLAGIYGWIIWSKQKRHDLVYRIPIRLHILSNAIAIAGAITLYSTMSTYFPEAKRPMIDALTTAYSFVATYMTAKKWITNWIYWIAIDAISVYLYFDRGLFIYAGLMLLYTGLAIYGYLDWQKLKLRNVA